MPNNPLWQPSAAQIEAAAITRFADKVGLAGAGYQSLWQWSIDQRADFWSAIWDFCSVVGDQGDAILHDGESMLEAQWFPDAKLNFAENCLRASGESDALVFWGEDQVKRSISHAELTDQVSRCQQLFSKAGLVAGDRVAAYLPNCPEAIVAMLAATSLGAVWCSASPDFGVDGVLDRFGQIEPKLFIACDGYFYAGKWLDCRGKNAQVLQQLPTVSKDLEVSYREGWANLLDEYQPQAVDFVRLPFDHPLYILFSSGTTGKPKCIVHGAGGTLLQHLKEHRLHSDIGAGDRLFYFTTCGWMMWNWLVTGLASEATLLLYDGNPMVSEGRVLFDLAEQQSVTHFGTSAKFIEACHKAGLEPGSSHDLAALRAIFSTGSPLAPASFRYVYDAIKADVHLASISGGTDIISCFALGNPTLPVWIGELQCLGLGMAVDAFDDNGQSVASGKGDLVCTRAFPSMPVGFWNDPHKERYRAAYFERFTNPPVWCHGDFVELTQHGEEQRGMIIHGRSDAILNPGGVRIGTAEIYRQVEKVPEVMESIVIGQQWDNDVRVVLFVKLQLGAALNDELEDKIRKLIRAKATPRHVPAVIAEVPDIPRTKSGKIVELAVRDVVHGREVKNVTSLANPEALEFFRNRRELS
ncbi:MAG: acetoacetate--CoA ligase [Gammaproteobacteria bacterium]|nr:acetoacetate--CoA ligase [Gammaproteobacteria bacterium]